MSSIINHNIPSLNSQRYLGVNNRKAEKSMSRLSSGLRVNSAADDAAGLAISEKMRGQIRGLDMAKKNAQDTSSLIQVAEGALDQSHAIMGRMRELAVQAANDTNTDDDRNELDKELLQLKKELDRIGNTTEFNTKKLLDGSMKGAKDAVKATYTLNNNSKFTFRGMTTNSQCGQTNIKDFEKNWNYNGTVTFIKIADTSIRSPGGANDPTNGEMKIIFHNENNADGESVALTMYMAIPSSSSSTDNWPATQGQNGSSPENIAINGQYGAGFVTLADGSRGSLGIHLCSHAARPQDSGFGVILAGTRYDFKFANTGLNYDTMEVGESFSINFSAAEKSIGNLDNSLMTQLGANTGHVTYASVGDMRSKALGLEHSRISTREQSIATIAEVDNATRRISAQRSFLGATQNRMEYAVNALETTSENVTAAESRIRDTNMASEMSSFTRENIKSQAAQTMVAQANSRAQNILGLLQ